MIYTHSLKILNTVLYERVIRVIQLNNAEMSQHVIMLKNNFNTLILIHSL